MFIQNDSHHPSIVPLVSTTEIISIWHSFPDLSHFISTLLLTLFLISFWHFPWFSSYSFSNFPLTCTRAGFLSVVDSWWGGFICVGLLCKRNTYIFRMLWSFLFSIEIWLQTNYFASQVFAVCHFVSWDVSGWGLLCKRNTNPAFAGQLTKKNQLS